MGHIIAIISLFLWSSVKYLTAPAYGLFALDMGFWENLIVNFLGGVAGITVFFRLSNYFQERARVKQNKKRELAELAGKVFVPKRKFTRYNKTVIRIKRSLGFWGLVLLTPAILSIPIGCIITAKFYHHRKWTYYALIGSMALTAFLLTSGAYWLNDVAGEPFERFMKNFLPGD